MNFDYGMPGRPFRNVTALLDAVQVFKNRPASIQDIYFCLSRQREHGKLDKFNKPWAKRSKQNTEAIKCIVLDIDVKPGPKGYPNDAEAVKALGKFCKDAALPPVSAIVHSGGGLHVYWISDRALTVEEWTQYARGLRNLATAHELRFDSSCTIDCARVLRVPGTYNLKESVPRPVTLRYLADADLDFERELGHIREAGVRPATTRVAQTFPEWDLVRLPPRPSRPELFSAEYQAEIGIVHDEKPPLDPLPILKACPFFANTAITGGKGHEQGLWMLTALACTHMERGREVFHGLSKGDPRYDPDTVDKMFDRKVAEREEKDFGWPSCVKFEEYGSQQCAGCPHRGKIRSPLNLPIAQPTPEQPKPSESVSVEPAPEEIESGVWIPDPYYIDEKTGLVMFNVERDKGKVTIEIPTEVLRYKITKIWPQLDTGVNFTVDRNEDGLKDVVVTYEDLGSDNSIGPALAKQKLTVHNPKIAGAFMKTLIEEYQKRKKSVHTVPFGWWQEEGSPDPSGWAYAGIMRKADGSTLPAARGDQATVALYTPRGEKDLWFRALKLITDQHRPDVEIITAVAFASPLLRFTGHFSGALVARSKSGGNKSTAVNVGGAVWGHPRKTKFTPSASATGIRLRLAQINNLPCYWDDIRKEQVPMAAALLSDLTHGADGLKATATRGLHETGSWQTILCICANGSIFDHFVEHNKSDAAGIYRIFEYEVSAKETAAPGSRIKEWDATYLQQQLEENFGRVGEYYSWVLANAPQVKAMLRSTQEHLAVELKYEDQEQERFWFALVSTLLLGAKLANEIGASFNIEEIHKFLLDAYKAMRTKLRQESTSGEDKSNVEHAVTEFFQEFGANMLWSTDMIKGPGPRQRINQQKGPEKDKDAVYVHWVVNERLLRIQKNKFKKFLTEKGYTASAVENGLTRYFNANMEHRADLSAGTTYTAGAMWLITIPVPVGSPFENALFAHTAAKSIRSEPLKVVHDVQPEQPSQRLQSE